MVSSMTGFGRGEASFEGGRFTVEVRSVNHRYSEFNIRLPRTLSTLEPRVKEMLRGGIQRGYVSYQLVWDRENGEQGELRLNDEVMRRYLELFGRMNSEYGIEGKPTVEIMSRLPDVFRMETREWDEEILWETVRTATGQALENLVRMRRKEGEVLAADLLARVDVMRREMDQASDKAPDRLDSLRENLKQKVREAIEGEAEIDENRLLSEITYYADKWDISEEEVRFAAHLDAFRDTIRKGGVIGRRLNFLVQEINRETNTVGSKANDAEIAQHMVRVKEELEKIREQVENIE